MRNSEHDVLINDLEICGLAFCMIHDFFNALVYIGSEFRLLKGNITRGLQVELT